MGMTPKGWLLEGERWIKYSEKAQKVAEVRRGWEKRNTKGKRIKTSPGGPQKGRLWQMVVVIK